MKLSRMFNTLPKRLAATGLVALAIFLPAISFAATTTVKIEADTTVSNATKNQGTMNWGSSATASYDEVVAIQVVYNNTEEAHSNKVANNLRVKINIPTTPGTNQTITTKTSADNSNTVNGSAKVTLNRDDAYLQYIPGTATWKHADTANGPMTTTQKVSDDVVMKNDGLVLENENPCQAGSIVVQARVMVPGLTVNKYVRHKGDTSWSSSITAKAGDTLQYEIAYKNTGNTDQKNVEFRDQLPKGVTYVPGSALIKNSVYPNATKLMDSIVSDGVVFGSYAPTADAYILLEVKVDSADKLACGENTLRNIAFVQPEGMNYYYNTADVVVNKKCEEKPNPPVYTCDAFDVTKGDNRSVTVSKFNFTAKNGATFKNAVISWGDSSADLTTNTVVGQKHTYAKDGTYTISAVAHFTVDGKDVTASGNCAKTVTFTTPGVPPELPNTGAGQVIGLFGAVAVVSAFAHRLFVSRRQTR